MLSNLIISHLISSYLISSHLISSYLTISYLITSYLISSYLILSYLILSYLILSYLVLSNSEVTNNDESDPQNEWNDSVRLNTSISSDSCQTNEGIEFEINIDNKEERERDNTREIKDNTHEIKIVLHQEPIENDSRTFDYNKEDINEEASTSNNGHQSIRSLAYLLSPRMNVGANVAGGNRSKFDVEEEDEVEKEVVDTSNSWAAKLFVKAFDNGRVRSATSLSEVGREESR